MGYEKVLVTPWGHDPTVVPLAALFTTVNEALMHSPVFIQVSFASLHMMLIIY